MRRAGAGIIIVILFAAIGYGGYYTIYKTEIFHIKKFDISGNKIVSKDVIEAKLDEFLDKNIFATDIGRIVEKILKIPMIKEVLVEKNLPDTIMIRIEEYNPEIVVYFQNQIFLAVDKGEIVGRWSPKYGLKLPVLVIERRTPLKDLKNIISVACKLQKKISKNLKELSIDEIIYDPLLGYKIVTRQLTVFVNWNFDKINFGHLRYLLSSTNIKNIDRIIILDENKYSVRYKNITQL